MPAYTTLTKATVKSIERKKTRKGNEYLKLFVSTYNIVGKKGNKPIFADVSIGVTVFNPEDAPRIDKDDQLKIQGTLNLDSNPKWGQVRREDRFDEDVELSDSKFASMTSYGDKIEVEGKGDRTHRDADRQARSTKGESRRRSKRDDGDRDVDYPITDHDDFEDDLPF